MSNHSMDSGPGEALASYRPSSLSSEQWARFGDDALALVGQLEHRNGKAARRCISRLAVFLADQSRGQPEATVEQLLTRTQVAGHLQRALDAGVSADTVRNRRGTLNALLRLQAGGTPTAPRRAAETRLAPYHLEELYAVLGELGTTVEGHAGQLRQTLACVLAGRRLPQHAAVTITLIDGQVLVDGQALTLPSDLPDPPSGRLDSEAVTAALAWARRRLQVRLDRRRLELVALTQLVATAPASEALRQPGVGRDRLSAAASAAARPDAATTAALLRGHHSDAR